MERQRSSRLGPTANDSEILEVTLGEPASGGGFVAHDADGRVLFIRHGLPGERVRVQLRDSRARFGRGDVIEVLEASPDRVDKRCPLAGPTLCGGCDWSHVDFGAQRRFKAQRLKGALAHSGIEADVVVESADETGLGTRTRLRFTTNEDGLFSFHGYRSDELIPVARCPLGVAPLNSFLSTTPHEHPGVEVEIRTVSATSSPSLVVREMVRSRRRVDVRDAHPEIVRVKEVDYLVSPTSFFQVHRRAPEMLVDAVFGGLNLGRGDKVLDLYCGVGLFTVPAAIAVGEAGRVVGIESATSACDDLMENAKDMTWVIVHEGRVNAHNVSRFGATMNVVIVDPPRRGIEPGVVEAIGAIETIREVVSVSCDIATFVRDLELFLAHGFHLRALRAFDLFEMTEHVEMVAHLER